MPYIMQQETSRTLSLSADIQPYLNALGDLDQSREDNPNNLSTSSSKPQPSTSHRRVKQVRDPERKFHLCKCHNKVHRRQTTCLLDMKPCHHCRSQGFFANGKNVVITGGSFYVINKSRSESGGKLVYPWNLLCH